MVVKTKEQYFNQLNSLSLYHILILDEHVVKYHLIKEVKDIIGLPSEDDGWCLWDFEPYDKLFKGKWNWSSSCTHVFNSKTHVPSGVSFFFKEEADRDLVMTYLALKGYKVST